MDLFIHSFTLTKDTHKYKQLKAKYIIEIQRTTCDSVNVLSLIACCAFYKSKILVLDSPFFAVLLFPCKQNFPKTIHSFIRAFKKYGPSHVITHTMEHYFCKVDEDAKGFDIVSTIPPTHTNNKNMLYEVDIDANI